MIRLPPDSEEPVVLHTRARTSDAWLRGKHTSNVKQMVQGVELHCRYVGSGLHGGIKEFLNSMNDEEAVGVISNLVRVQAVVGTGAAVREGEDSIATLAWLAFTVGSDTKH